MGGCTFSKPYLVHSLSQMKYGSRPLESACSNQRGEAVRLRICLGFLFRVRWIMMFFSLSAPFRFKRYTCGRGLQRWWTGTWVGFDRIASFIQPVTVSCEDTQAAFVTS